MHVVNPKSGDKSHCWVRLPTFFSASLPLFFALLPLWAASAALAGDPGAEGDLYVSTGSSHNSVVQFNGPSGVYVGDFVPQSSGGLSGAEGLTFGPNGNLFVASRNTHEVIEYDGTTGDLIGTFASGGGLEGPTGLTFGPNGNLFVSSRYTSNVIEFHGLTGALIGTFASGGGLARPTGLTFGPNGNLFVGSYYTDSVIEFDGTTGALIGTFASGGGMSDPYDLTFGPNGNLFVSSWYTDTVIEYDGVSGAVIGTFASQGLFRPTGLTFGPDGSLFVATEVSGTSDGRIMQYYADSGALLRTFAESDWQLEFVTFKPLPGPFPQPSISGFAPAQADNCAPLVDATLTGTGLVWGAQLRLTRAGEADVLGAITGLTPDTAISMSFDLGGGAVPGLWDLVLTYPDDRTDTLVDALEITACPGPEVIAIDPTQDDNCDVPGLTAASITGSGFLAGATVTLAMTGQPDIPGTDVDVQSSTIVLADFDPRSAATGLWDVVVTNPDQPSGTLPGGFEITECPPPVIDSISPTRIIRDGPLAVRVYGTDLWPPGGSWTGTSLTLRHDGWPDVTDSSADQGDDGWVLFRNFAIAGYPLGFYDVILTRSDGWSDTVVDGLEIVADPGVRIRRIGAWGGSVDAIFVEQNGDQRLAYTGSGRRLVVLDVTDPANIIELGSVTLEGVITDLQVRDGYAYVGAAQPAWFCVVDVHDPTAPVLVASRIAETSALLIRQVEFDGTGQFVFVAEWDQLGQAIDISDPTAPVYVGPCGGLSPFTFGGSLQYSVNDSGYLGTYDLSEGCPGTILAYAQIPELQSSNRAANCVLVGDYLYVTSCKYDTVIHSSIVIVDVFDPEAPFLVGTWGDPTGESFRFGAAIAVSEGRLYWAGSSRYDSQSRTLVILDIATDPTAPTLIGEYSSDASFYRGIFVLGTTAYLGDLREGLTIVDCSDPASPQRVGNYFSPSEFGQGALDGDKLYVTDETYGVTTVDVADPRTPALIGKFETGTYTADRHRMQNWGIAVRDGLAYVAAGKAGLQVVDVTDPTAPTLAGEFADWPSHLQSRALALSPDEPIVHLGVHTFAGSCPAWVVNFDVSDLANIVDVGDVYVGSGHPCTIVRRANGIAYVARDTATATLNLSDAEEPMVLNVGYPRALDVAVDGDVLYTVNDYGNDPEVSGLDIFSVPAAYPIPTAENRLAHYGEDPLTGSWYLWGYAAAASNERAYVCLFVNHRPNPILEVLDVSDPAQPSPLAAEQMGGAYAMNIIVDEPYVYAITRTWEGAAGSAGVLSYLVYGAGDFDHDHDVDLRDFAGLQRCFTGGGPIPEDAWLECLPLDFDEDNDVDLDDFAAFVEALENPPPPTPTGACCLPDGTCTDGVTAPSCAVYPLYGEYQGNDTTCATVTCPPTGACCLPDGACAELTLFGCVASDGAYQGDYTTCGGVVCPLGACCFIDDGSCLDTSPTACAASGGTYQGDATTCGLIDCPFGRYSNEIDPVTQFALAGAGLQLADDLTLAGTGARDLVFLDLRVYGGNSGGGDFDVTVELWTDCPGNGGTLIPGTTFSWTGVPDDGYVWGLVADPVSPAVTIPDTVWMVATFTTPESGWIIAEDAEVGFTEDFYGHNDPPWACNYYFGGTPYAGLWANLRCVEGGGKRGAGKHSFGRGQASRLHMMRVDADGPPAALEAVE